MKPNRMCQAREFLADKNNDSSDFREALPSSDHAYVNTLIELLQCDDKRVKNRAAKLIARLSAENPRVVYPHWERLADRAAGNDRILRWNALMAIGLTAHLAAAAEVQSLLPGLYPLLGDESMVTAGHAIDCLGRIATGNVECRPMILNRMLAIGDIPRDPECTRILIGKVLAALEALIPVATAEEKAAVLDFVEEHEQSPRPATRKLAGRLKKML